MYENVQPIITSVTKEGFDGIFYPTLQNENVIIFISGSEGGLGTGKIMGSYYQGLGYSTLALGLFHTRHTNKSLSKVPIEKRPAGNSCWSYKGSELPYIPYKTRKISKLKMLR